jgi:hypothetical protein
MHKKKVLVNFLLAAMVIAGLFVSPIQGQKAGAAPLFTLPSYYVDLKPLTLPPQTICVGDRAPISLLATNMYAYHNLSGPAYNTINWNGIRGGVLSATATGGTLSRSAWDFGGENAYGLINTTYTATTAGPGQIMFQSNGSSYFSLSGSSTIGPFTVQECSKTLIIKASDHSTLSDSDVDMNIDGKGGIKINIAEGSTRGTVTGGGTYYYKLLISFRPPAPTTKCDKYATLINQQPFNVTGESANDSFDITIDFTPFDFPAGEVNCKDTNGFSYSVQVVKPKHVDISKLLPAESR